MTILLAAMALAVRWTCAAQAGEARTRYTIKRGDVAIDVIDEGKGPLMVLLPSSGRDSEDYDAVAEGLAKGGFHVLRPQPRGDGASPGPTEGITLHDLGNDVAVTIENARDGRAVVVGTSDRANENRSCRDRVVASEGPLLKRAG